MGYRENKIERAMDNWCSLQQRVNTEIAVVAGAIAELERLVSLELEAEATHIILADTSPHGKREAQKLKTLSSNKEYCRAIAERRLKQRQLENLFSSLTKE